MPCQSRRTFLKCIALGGTGIGLASLIGCERVEWVTDDITPSLPLITPVEKAYVLTQSAVPPQDLERFQVTIRGACRRDVELSLSDLQRLLTDHDVSYLHTMVSIFDTPDQDLCYTGIFGGIPLERLIEMAHPEASVVRVNLKGADGFCSSLPLSEIHHPMHGLPPIVAFSHNGQDLTHDHGRPIRAVIPGLYGYKSVKYLTEIELSLEPSPIGHIESMFHTKPDQPMAGGTKMRQPLDTAWLPPGDVLILGYCLPGPVPTRGVALQIDDGPWSPVRLKPVEPLVRGLPVPFDELSQGSSESGLTYPFPGVWAPWSHIWRAEPGHHVIRARVSTMPDWRDLGTEQKTRSSWIDEIDVQVG